MPASLTTIPREILLKIFRNWAPYLPSLDDRSDNSWDATIENNRHHHRAALRSLCLTCRHLLPTAREVLYYAIDLRYHVPTDPTRRRCNRCIDTRSAMARLARTMIQNPSLRRLVRHLDLHELYESQNQAYQWHVRPPKKTGANWVVVEEHMCPVSITDRRYFDAAKFEICPKRRGEHIRPKAIACFRMALASESEDTAGPPRPSSWVLLVDPNCLSAFDLDLSYMCGEEVCILRGVVAQRLFAVLLCLLPGLNTLTLEVPREGYPITDAILREIMTNKEFYGEFLPCLKTVQLQVEPPFRGEPKAVVCPWLLAWPNARVGIRMVLGRNRWFRTHNSFQSFFRVSYSWPLPSSPEPPAQATGQTPTSLCIELDPAYTGAFDTLLPLFPGLRRLTLKVDAGIPGLVAWSRTELLDRASQLDGLRHLEVSMRLLLPSHNGQSRTSVLILPAQLEVLELVDVGGANPDGSHDKWSRSVVSWLEALAAREGQMPKSLSLVRLGVERTKAAWIYHYRRQFEEAMHAAHIDLQIYDLEPERMINRR